MLAFISSWTAWKSLKPQIADLLQRKPCFLKWFLGILGRSIIFKITPRFLLRLAVFSDYLSVSCDYDKTDIQNLNIFLILYSINDYIIGLFPTAVEVEYFGVRVKYKIRTDEVRNLSKVFNDLEKGTVLSA